MAEPMLRGILIIPLTLIVGLMLGLLPLPSIAPPELNYLRPDWLGLVVVYWLLAAPEKVGVGFAFLVSLLGDLVFGTPLGFHGLVMVLMAALILSSYQQLRMLEIWQQALLIAFALEILTCLQLIVLGVTDDRSHNFLILLRPLTSALVWPWVFLILRFCRLRYA